MAAALGLGYYSYRSANRLAERSAESVQSSNRVLGLKLVDRIEKVILDTDRTFFKLVSLDDPREFMELWRRIVRISPAVQSVIVLDDQREVVHFVAKLAPAERRGFHELFARRIVPDLELGKLAPDEHKHLHTSYGAKSYLLSYIRRRSAGRDYYIALNYHIPYIIHEIFREEFKELEETRAIAVMDEGGGVLYGWPVFSDSKLVFEAQFPTTLYRWRLQISPRDIASFRRQARARKLSDLVLVATSLSVILVGMAVLIVAARKERRANQLKSEFISNVSHELKTPLSLIRMFGELLSLRGASDPKASKEYAEIITRESDRLTALIDNVLDFARIERGKAAYQFSHGRLEPVVEQVVELCRYRAEQGGVRIATRVAPDLPELLFDASALTLLLLNLLENALKYGAVRGGEILVSVERQERRVLLRVADQGPGIAKEEQRRIFERFYRGQDARGSSARGSGIGLSLVKHIVEAHHGRVRVESELGKGASFEVSLPIAEPEPIPKRGGAR
ncbi:MAG: HAMP domain-containing histidine kinase [Deltaproteobacteria bacterium]|nr:HAMP domain-containing histidine kinase [Deltaproteobacteria bacterium]